MLLATLQDIMHALFFSTEETGVHWLLPQTTQLVTTRATALEPLEELKPGLPGLQAHSFLLHCEQFNSLTVRLQLWGPETPWGLRKLMDPCKVSHTMVRELSWKWKFLKKKKLKDGQMKSITPEKCHHGVVSPFKDLRLPVVHAILKKEWFILASFTMRTEML